VRVVIIDHLGRIRYHWYPKRLLLTSSQLKAWSARGATSVECL